MPSIQVEVGAWHEHRGKVLYRFAPQELRLIQAIARARSRASIAAGMPDGVYRADNDSDYVHELGFRAEWAVARLLGTLPDLNIYAGGDKHQPDVQIRDMGIEVKMSTWRPDPDFKLKSNNMDDFQSDFGVLCRPRTKADSDNWLADSHVVIMGYISRDEFARVHQVKDYTYGPRLVVHCHQLSPILELVGLIDGNSPL